MILKKRFILIFLLFISVFSCDCLASKKSNKRPSWGMIKIEQLGCLMNVRNYILLANGSDIELKKEKGICKVVSGSWEVLDGDNGEYILITDPKDIEIDHIVPWSYLKRNVNKKDYNFVFNMLVNLKPVSKRYNRNKKDKVCDTEQLCNTQQYHCELIKTELDKQNIDNTIDCGD